MPRINCSPKCLPTQRRIPFNCARSEPRLACSGVEYDSGADGKQRDLGRIPIVRHRTCVLHQSCRIARGRGRRSLTAVRWVAPRHCNSTRFQAVLVALLVSAAAKGSAQGLAGDTLVRRFLPGNITLLLPASWVPVSDTTRDRVRASLDTALEHSRDTLVQASLRRGKPVVLMNETVPGQLDQSASLNAAPSPGSTTRSFDVATPEQIASATSSMCRAVGEMLPRLGASLISCDPVSIERQAPHTIAITRIVRSGPRGFVTLWLAQFAGQGVIYTLTLSAPQAREERYRQLFQTIWRSVTIPER